MMRATPATHRAAPAAPQASGRCPSDPPAPEHRHRDEHPAVGRVDSPEVGGLERRHHPVAEEHERAEGADPPGPPLAQPEPHQVAAADLHQPGQNEEVNGTRRRAHFKLSQSLAPPSSPPTSSRINSFTPSRPSSRS